MLIKVWLDLWLCIVSQSGVRVAMHSEPGRRACRRFRLELRS